MTEPTPQQRSYGCTFACGNPYDYVVISVADSTTEFLCLPCYVKLAADMLAAVTSPDSAEVREALSLAGDVTSTPQTHDLPKSRGKNAPVTSEDDDVIETFSSVVMVVDLPEEFR